MPASESVSLFAAFLAGLVSFVSPCVLPIVPGYLSFISGVNLAQLKGAGAPAALTRRVRAAGAPAPLSWARFTPLMKDR